MAVEPDFRRAGHQQVAGHHKPAVEGHVFAEQLLQRAFDPAAAVQDRRVPHNDGQVGLRGHGGRGRS